MQVTRAFGLAGAATATGPTIIIDVFRAFSAAAYAFAAGAREIILAEAVNEAVEIAASRPGSILMGEDGGVRPEEFDIGNSPGEIVADPAAVSDKTVVHRSSPGTRCARAAVAAGAGPVYVASLVVASATVEALRPLAGVTIVAAGLGGVETADEDQLCAELLESLLHERTVDLTAAGERIAALERARTLRAAEVTHPDDIPLCTIVDRFGFAMRAEIEDGLLVVRSQS